MPSRTETKALRGLGVLFSLSGGPRTDLRKTRRFLSILSTCKNMLEEEGSALPLEGCIIRELQSEKARESKILHLGYIGTDIHLATLRQIKFFG